MNELRRIVAMYGPLMFLGGLVWLSFWLSPSEEVSRAPALGAVMQNARYVRLQEDGIVKISADTVRQLAPGRAQLDNPRLQHSKGNMFLEGESGIVNATDPLKPRMSIKQVRGVIAGNGQQVTLHAQSVLYDSGNGVLSGELPLISGRAGELRGDYFNWSAGKGLKIYGNVQSVYQQ